MEIEERVVAIDEPILVSGAVGFIGARVASNLLELDIRHVRYLIRTTADIWEQSKLSTSSE